MITRHGYQGLWYEKEIVFDASMMQKGTNTIKIIVPQGAVNNGMVWDYVRLEVDENATANYGEGSQK